MPLRRHAVRGGPGACRRDTLHLQLLFETRPVAAYYGAGEFKLTTARDRVSTYQWNSYIGQHHHCGVCGCGTYSEFPDFSTGKPDFGNMKVAINARLFDRDAFDLESIPVKVVDGKNDW